MDKEKRQLKTRTTSVGFALDRAFCARCEFYITGQRKQEPFALKEDIWQFVKKCHADDVKAGEIKCTEPLLTFFWNFAFYEVEKTSAAPDVSELAFDPK